MSCTCVSLDLPEFLENHLLIFRPDADACVGYGDASQMRTFSTSDVDSAGLGREFDRIAKQVAQDLFEAHALGIYGSIRPQRMPHLNVFGHRQGMNDRKNFRQSVPDLELFAVELELPGL